YGNAVTKASTLVKEIGISAKRPQESRPGLLSGRRFAARSEFHDLRSSDVGQGAMTASTVPVPAWPYPGSVRTTTIRKMSPETVEADRVIELDTITAI